ncbi:AAA family ATPase [Hungatella hathewayi]|uniref:AAA family ATPase n=1 Tax=Hungatella hathewayi TaxID=154046 RepID=UPI00356314DF
MVQNKIIAVMGSPGGGKTTASIKLAAELAEKKKNVILVFCDPFTPVIPFVASCQEEQVSIGTLLTTPSLTQKMILDSCIPIKENRYISLLGYRLGDSLMAYPQITRDRAVDFLVCLRYLADFIVMDCSAVFEADVLSMLAMELSDQIIKIGTSNLRGISYFESRSSLLSDRRFQPEKQRMYLGNLKTGQEWEAVSVQYGGVDGILPHLMALEQQYDEQALFEPLAGKEAVPYQAAIRKLAEQIVESDRVGQEDGNNSRSQKATEKKEKIHPTKQEKQKVKSKPKEQTKPVKEKARGLEKFSLPFRKNKGEF